MPCDEVFANQQQITQDFLDVLCDMLSISIKEEVSREAAVDVQQHLLPTCKASTRESTICGWFTQCHEVCNSAAGDPEAVRWQSNTKCCLSST